MKFALQNKRAVIVGASAPGSMGAVLAERLLASGAKVVISARNPGSLEALAADFGCSHKVCDITDESQVAALADYCVKTLGGLDIAVNGAGQAVMGDIANTDEKELRRAIDVHLIGTFFFFKHMQRAIQKDGSMITISSLTASQVINNHAAYMAAKAGADHLVKVAAMEFGEKNIRVNSVAPGFTGDTPMSQKFMELPGLRETFERQIPLGRLNTAHDVAQSICWLADDETYVTGQTIQVNGGHSLTRMPSKQDFTTLVKNHNTNQLSSSDGDR